MSEIIGEPALKLKIEGSEFKKGLDEQAANLGASMQKSERLAASGAKRIQQQIDTLNATKPRQSMFELSQAVQKMGGVFALSSDQIERLRKQVDLLSAAGARVPKNLAGIQKVAAAIVPGAGAGLGQKAASAAAGNLAGSLAPGGALTAGLTAIGPAGLAAAAGVGAVALAAKAATETVGALVDRAGKLTDLSEKTGLSTDALQKLDFVGAQVGVSLDASATAVSKLQKTLGEAALGSQTARDAFKDVGLSWEELRKLSPEQQFARVSSALATIPDQERMVAAGAGLMGKGFVEIVPLVKHAQEVMGAPVAIDAKTVAQLDDLGDAWTRLGAAADNVKMQLGLALLQGFTGGADAAGAIDTITNAVTGLAKILSNSIFVSAIKTFDSLFLGIGRTVTALAAEGKADADMAKATAFAKKFGEDRSQKAKTEAALEAARKREELKATAGARAKAAAQEESQRKKNLDAFKQLAEEEFKFRNETYKREHAAAEKFWDDQVKLAHDASERILADALLSSGIKATQVNAAGELVQVVSQSALDAGRRRASAAQSRVAGKAGAPAEFIAGGSGQLLSEISDEGLPGKFFSRFKDVNDELKKTGGHLFANTKETFKWDQQLQNVANIIQGMPGGLGKVGALTSSLASGIAGIKSSRESFDLAKKAGGLGGALGQVSAIFGGVSAAIGIGTAIVGLFKKDPVKEAMKAAGKILGHGISKELAQQFVEESKRTGKSIADVTKKWQADQEKAAADAKRKNVEEGLGAARSGLEALLGDIAKLQDTPALQAAISGIEAKVADAVAKSGLGFIATGALRDSEAFGAAQSASRSGGQVLAGLRQAGAVDEGVTAAMTGLATELQRQAIEAARAAGLTDQEAQKAGSGAIVDILREQLNASLASGRELDANTQKLIEEAKANGIDIVADPLLQQLKVQQQSLTELESIRSLMAGGGSVSSGVRDTTLFQAQNGLRPSIMPHVGRGLGPLIQTHPGELALVVPRASVGGRLDMFRGAGRAATTDSFAPRSSPGAGDAAGISFSAEFPVKFDQTVSYETAQRFARAVAEESRRLFDAGDPDFVRSVRRRLGLGTA